MHSAEAAPSDPRLKRDWIARTRGNALPARQPIELRKQLNR